MSENKTQAPPPPPPNQPVAPPPTSPNPDSPARTWNMLCHLSALVGFLGIPFGNIIGPLIVWQIKKNEFPSVNVHGKAALNFQITATLVMLVGFGMACVGKFICIGWLLFPLVVLLGIGALVVTVIAGIKANNGEPYQYPFSFELVK